MLKTGYLLLVAVIGLHIGLIEAMKRTIEEETNAVTQVEEVDVVHDVLPICPPTPRKKSRVVEPRRPARDLLTRERVEDGSDLARINSVPRVLTVPRIGNLDERQRDTAPVSLQLFVVLESVEAIGQLLTAYPHLVHQKNEDGNTELHKAIRNHLEWYVALLCDRGAHVREPNKAGETPLSIAERTFRDIVPLLRRYLPRTLIAY